MYFPNNYDNYLQDMFFYNQNPNTYVNNSLPNPNFFYPNQTMNISSYYPSLYKILIPVIIKVIQNSNYPYLNEEIINNITDSVFNIVEGDILKENANQPMNNNQQSSSNSANNNSNSNYSNKENSKSTEKENALLRDIIKILVIKELQNRQIKQINQNIYGQF